MGKIRRLSDEQREKLAGSRENLLSAAKCIDELLCGHDIRDVPFERDALVELMRRMVEANLGEVRELQRRYRHIGQMNDIAEDCLATLRDMGRELEREPIGTASRDLSLEDLPAELELSTRALNCLKRCRIFTLGDLLDSGVEKKSDLLGIRHMGVKSAEEVARVMRRCGAPITEN